jgi:hypothetical protein
MNKRILKIALSKVQHHYGRIWCGTFTPCEIMALVEDGARPVHPEHWKSDKEWIEQKIKNGISDQTWFYFEKEGLIQND